MPTAYVTHPRYTEHDLRDHPEHAGRIRAIWEQLADLSPRMLALEPEAASRESLLRVHSTTYLDQLEDLSRTYPSTVLITPDTYLGPASFEIARLSAGGVMLAIDAVLSGRAHNALAVVRPPGHHALRATMMGFCLLSNVAIGVRHAQAVHGLDRILIVDYDVHHGNGTQDMLYDDAHSLFLSTHQSPFYPGTGDLYETGTGDGAGFTVNVPLIAGHGDNSYSAVYREVVWPVAERYHPQLIIVSAGFDAHWRDPLAEMRLSLSGYDHLNRELIAMAEQFCDGRPGAH